MKAQWLISGMDCCGRKVWQNQSLGCSCCSIAMQVNLQAATAPRCEPWPTVAQAKLFAAGGKLPKAWVKR